ncbi:MAG TPA: hypothetical protein VGH74_17165 [Planctomycetaceae bacterium]
MSSPSSNDQLDHIEPEGDDQASSRASSRAGSGPSDAVEKRVESAAKANVQAGEVEQQAASRKKRSGRSSRRHEIKSDLQFMISANREAGGRGVYSGFRFVRAGGIELSPDEEPYLGAFLPLKVALKYPRLLKFTTLTYEDVFVNEHLDPKTRTVRRPGRFIRYGIITFISRTISLIKSVAFMAAAIIALAALVWYGLRFKRIR